MTESATLELIHEAMVFALGDGVPDRDRLDGDANLSDLGVESVASLEIAGYIEDRLAVRFPDDELGGLSTVSDVVELIHRHRVDPTTLIPLERS